MKLRVKASATKGHWVHGELIQPGQPLPGNYDKVPETLAHKLEAVPAAKAEAWQPPAADTTVTAPQGPLVTIPPAGGPTAAQEEAENGVSENGDAGRPDWYKELTRQLGKEPNKDELADYARQEFAEELDPAELKKDEMIAAISKLEDEALHG